MLKHTEEVQNTHTLSPQIHNCQNSFKQLRSEIYMGIYPLKPASKAAETQTLEDFMSEGSPVQFLG